MSLHWACDVFCNINITNKEKAFLKFNKIEKFK